MGKDNGQAGEKEMRKVFEGTATRNIKAGIAHGNETRKMVRALEERMLHLENNFTAEKQRTDQFRIQLASLQQRMYASGSGPLVTKEEVVYMIDEMLKTLKGK